MAESEKQLAEAVAKLQERIAFLAKRPAEAAACMDAARLKRIERHDASGNVVFLERVTGTR